MLRATSSGGAATDQALADQLVEMGQLNPWLAKQLLDGRTKFTLGPYRIVDSLGQGGMGHVYKAEHPLLLRTVAIKVLPREKSSPEAIANFTREIQAQASLNHPKLVRAMDAGHDGNVYFLVTEFVPGSDLRKLVRRVGPLDMAQAASIISQVAEALHHAHLQGLVHRDVKPGNVLVTPEGEAKLSDLGLAGPMYYAGAQNDPRYGKIVGTVDYLSPDHIQSPWNPTPAWDIYSLGCTLYYAVTSKVPFPGGSTADKARAHCELRPLDPRRLNPELHDAFVDVLADMMAKEPAQRVPSAAVVIERLSPWTRATASGPWPATGYAPPSAPPGHPPMPVSSPPAPGVPAHAPPVETSSALPAPAAGPAATPPVPVGGSALPLPPPPVAPVMRHVAIPTPPPPPTVRSGPPPLPPPSAVPAVTVARPGTRVLPPPASQPTPPQAALLADTVTDLPSPPEIESDESVSVVVPMPRRPMPSSALLAMVLVPLAVILLSILVGWTIDALF